MAVLELDIQKLEMASSKLRAMAHPMRIAILELLHKNKQLSVTDIYKSLKIEQAAASHHLNILKNKGVLVSQRDGKKIFYALKSEVLTEIIDCIRRCNEEDF
jgi:DNA-binding transcriptional ArsR family regulator